MKFCQPISYLNTKKDYQHLNQYLNVQLMCFNWYTSFHNLNAYQIKLFNQLEKKENKCLHIVSALGSSNFLQGIVLFQSLKFYDVEVPCKQANLLDTDLLVLDVIDDFELFVAVVNAYVYYIAGYILSNLKKFTDLN